MIQNVVKSQQLFNHEKFPDQNIIFNISSIFLIKDKLFRKLQGMQINGHVMFHKR
jgi:hypothetical protein